MSTDPVPGQLGACHLAPYSSIDLMDAGEIIVAEYLMDKGFRPERFSKSEQRNGKTPDYRVFRDEEFAFFCEVKTIPLDTWWGGLRNDPTFNRLSGDIHDAVKQFDAVNPKLEHPNVLAIVNQDFRTGFTDLVNVTTGCAITDEGAHPIYRRFSEGRIKEEKSRIHLYVWLDNYKANRLYFNLGLRHHLVKLCSYFGVEPESIRYFGA